MPARLSRAERKEQTRAALLESATVVLAERGMERASIDDIAAHAGFTKGAFYAHFDSKDELFLTLLDRHFADVLDRVQEVLDVDDDLEEQARAGAASFIEFVSASGDWERVSLDFSGYAARNPEFGAELVARRRALREGIATLIGRRMDELGIEPAVPADQVALMVFAMAGGIALERLLEPEAVPDDLYPTMLATFFAGLQPPQS